MALPELTQPDGTPPFLAEGHAIDLVDVYAELEMDTGHNRKQRIYTAAPRLVTVGLRLTAAQMLAWHEWYEGPLQAGLKPFAAQVANQGPGLLWWKARITADRYSAESGDGGASFKVTTQLRLVGSGTTTPPYTAALQASAQVALVGQAAFQVPIALRAAGSVALETASYLHAAAEIALRVPDYYEREDGGYIEREDGNKLQRE